jgi:hypothetical protein
MNGITHTKKTSWQEVFEIWKSQEGSDPVWQRFATEEKGWDSWEAWRQYQFGWYGDIANWNWEFCTIDEPNILVPQFRIGPYRGWQQHFDEPFVHTFADLIDVAGDWVRSNIGVQARLRQFPQGTQFIGLYIEQSDTIVLMEGHHRSAAVALAVADDDPIVFTTLPTIALARYIGDEIPMLERVLSMSSERPK